LVTLSLSFVVFTVRASGAKGGPYALRIIEFFAFFFFEYYSRIWTKKEGLFCILGQWYLRYFKKAGEHSSPAFTISS